VKDLKASTQREVALDVIVDELTLKVRGDSNSES
jgi:hypothetical protein